MAEPMVPGPVPAVKKDDQTTLNVKKDRAEEQATLKTLADVVKKGDYFEQQEAFAKAFEEREGEDAYRRAARIEREREAALHVGDPTRDPVAKQKAMDLNTVAPGVAADAQKMKDASSKP